MAASLAEAKDAVLARLRVSPAPFEDLLALVGDLAGSAVVELMEEGRVVQGGAKGLSLSAAQRELDELRAEGPVEHTAARIRELEEAEAANGRWLKIAHDATARADAALTDAASWREVALSLPLAPQSREHGSGAGDDIERGSRKAIASWLTRLWLGCEAAGMDRDFVGGARAAAWIALHGHVEPKIHTARLLLGDGTFVRCAVLGLGRSVGVACVLAAPEVGRVAIGDDGRAVGGPARLHPEDLAALRGDRAAALDGAQVEG